MGRVGQRLALAMALWAAVSAQVALEPVADGEGRRAVLVLNLRPLGIAPERAAPVTAQVVEHLATYADLDVVSVAEIDALARHQRSLSKVGCEDESCIAELSRLANAQLALSGSVGVVGQQVVINLSLVDTETSRSVGHGNRVVDSLDSVVRWVSTAEPLISRCDDERFLWGFLDPL